MQRPLTSIGLLIPKSLRDRLLGERLEHLPRETGGYLIGRRRGPHIEVTDATSQGPADIATSVSFDRADPGHTRAAVEVWRQDRALSGVVGDWHSHPSGEGRPSNADLHAWRVLARSEKGTIAGLIFVDGAMTAHLAVARRLGTAITPLALIEETEAELVYVAEGVQIAPPR